MLKPIQPPDISVAEKERLIQSGQRHYSEMVTHEHPVSARYDQLFTELTQRYQYRLAQDVINLAEHIRRTRIPPFTLVSLARAGTPIGALLQRALRGLGVDVEHYSVSIIRDRGIDQRALQFILQHQQRPAEGVIFIDGWTAKGVITTELKRAVAHWNETQAETLTDQLYVIADPGGVADVAATRDDYVIPSGILGATVSGLVSRSILNEQITPDDFHGCVVYEHLQAQDRSNWFLDAISSAMKRLDPQPLSACDRAARQAETSLFLERISKSYGVIDINHIKPGVLEATRVLLRRLPRLLLLRDPDGPDTEHLRLLALEKDIAVACDYDMPYKAVALIETLIPRVLEA